jgi:hypothetical protein
MPESVELSVGAVRTLIESGRVTASAASPLSALLRQAEAAGTTPSSADGVPALDGPFADALAIVGQPEALVKLLATDGSPEQKALSVAVKDGRATVFSLGDDGLTLAPAGDLETLAASLPAGLTYAGPLAGGEVFLWPSVITTLTALWADKGDVTAPLSRAQTVAWLSGPELAAHEAEILLEQTIASGALEADGDRLRIPAALQPWLALVWSGHSAQIEYLPLDPDTPLESALEGAGDHVLFVGPPGQRVVNEAVTGEALTQRLGGVEPPEDTLIHLWAPAPEDVRDLVRNVLRLPVAQAAA